MWSRRQGDERRHTSYITFPDMVLSFFVLLIVFGGMGYAAGVIHAEASIRKDCVMLGEFRSSSSVFECRRRQNEVNPYKERGNI